MYSRFATQWSMRSLILIALMAVLVGAWPTAPARAQEGAQATVVPYVLNMRHGPGDDYAIIGKLSNGTTLTLLARDDSADNALWVFVRTPQQGDGWVHADYIQLEPGTDLDLLPARLAPADKGTPMTSAPVAPDAAAVTPPPADTSGGFPSGSGIPATTTANVNQRAGAGTGYRVFRTIPAGTSLLAKGRSGAGDWIFGTVGPQDGWLYASFVRLSSGVVSQLPVVDVVAQQAAAAPANTAGDTAFVPAPVAGGSGLTSFGYGGHVDSFSYPGLMQQAGMTWVKRQVRFSQGQSGASVAGLIDQAHGSGFKILLGIVGLPGQVNNPGYFEDYARFVAEVAALGPDAIEVWNEQNLDREWPNGQIDPARYTQLLAQAYNAIKGANPNVAVISGAPAPTGAEGAFGSAAVWNDDRYVRGMAAAGAAQYMDCIGAHYNEGIVPPGWTSGDPRGGYYTRYFWGMVNTYSSAFGGAKPVCFTELGYLTPEGFGPLPGAFAWASDTSVSEQATWLAQAVSLARRSGRVKLVIIWNVDFTNYDGDPMAGYAMVRPDGSCPACDALARIR